MINLLLSDNRVFAAALTSGKAIDPELKTYVDNRLLAIAEARSFAFVMANYGMNIPCELVKKIAQLTPSFQALSQEARDSIPVEKVYANYKKKANS